MHKPKYLVLLDSYVFWGLFLLLGSSVRIEASRQKQKLLSPYEHRAYRCSSHLDQKQYGTVRQQLNGMIAKRYQKKEGFFSDRHKHAASATLKRFFELGSSVYLADTNSYYQCLLDYQGNYYYLTWRFNVKTERFVFKQLRPESMLADNEAKLLEKKKTSINIIEATFYTCSFDYSLPIFFRRRNNQKPEIIPHDKICLQSYTVNIPKRMIQPMICFFDPIEDEFCIIFLKKQSNENKRYYWAHNRQAIYRTHKKMAQSVMNDFNLATIFLYLFFQQENAHIKDIKGLCISADQQLLEEGFKPNKANTRIPRQILSSDTQEKKTKQQETSYCLAEEFIAYYSE